METPNSIRVALCPRCDDVHVALGAVTVRMSKAEAAALSDTLRRACAGDGTGPIAGSANQWTH